MRRFASITLLLLIAAWCGCADDATDATDVAGSGGGGNSDAGTICEPALSEAAQAELAEALTDLCYPRIEATCDDREGGLVAPARHDVVDTLYDALPGLVSMADACWNASACAYEVECVEGVADVRENDFCQPYATGCPFA